MSRPQHVFVTHIRTTPEKLWEAITSPAFTRRYFHETSVESAWTEGAPVVYRMKDGGVAAEGKVLEVDRPRRLSFTWLFLYDPELAKESPSRVAWEIEPQGDGCRLTLVHGDFEGETATYRAVGEGWPGILEDLKKLLETGEPASVASA